MCFFQHVFFSCYITSQTASCHIALQRFITRGDCAFTKADSTIRRCRNSDWLCVIMITARGDGWRAFHCSDVLIVEFLHCLLRANQLHVHKPLICFDFRHEFIGRSLLLWMLLLWSSARISIVTGYRWKILLDN